MELEDRWYQIEAVAKTMDCIFASSDFKNHPVVVAPTGSGKSVINCKIIDEFLTRYPMMDVICLSHVSDILEQNYNKIEEYLGDQFLALNSAQLGERGQNKITVAGIQSVYRNPEKFSKVGLALIDECHMVNSKENGMYRKFLKELNCCYAGLTATPFRTGQGYIYKKYPGFNPLFNCCSYDLSSFDNYNRLEQEGYLSPLISAPTSYKMDTSGLSLEKGDYKEAELSDRFDKDDVTAQILDNVIKYGKNKYKKWLLFAIDKMHAIHIAHELTRRGYPCAAVYSGMKEDKAEILKKYRKGELRAVVNVNMLTTGIDIPDIDLIALMRPSESPIYHVQTMGRGARPCPFVGKTHCLILDYAGNLMRHGPINDIKIYEPHEKKPKRENALPQVKVCGNCGSENGLRERFCVACGEEFVNQKLSAVASNEDAVRREKKNKKAWLKVRNVRYMIHQKNGAPSSLLVQYTAGVQVVKEWVSINHKNGSYAKRRAKKWVENRWEGNSFPPDTLEELYPNANLLKTPERIFVNMEGKYPVIEDFDFGD